MYSVHPSTILINLINNNGTIVSMSDIIVSDNVGNTLKGNINIDIRRRQKWNMTLMLKYNCSSLIVNSTTKTICKFV